MSIDDVDELIAQQENENTKNKTMYDLNIALKSNEETDRTSPGGGGGEWEEGVGLTETAF